MSIVSVVIPSHSFLKFIFAFFFVILARGLSNSLIYLKKVFSFIDFSHWYVLLTFLKFKLRLLT